MLRSIEFNFFLEGKDLSFEEGSKLDVVLEVNYYLIRGDVWCPIGVDPPYDLPKDEIKIDDLEVLYFGLIPRKKVFLGSFKNKNSLNGQSEDVWDNLSEPKQKQIIKSLKEILDQKDFKERLEESIVDELSSKDDERYYYGR